MKKQNLKSEIYDLVYRLYRCRGLDAEKYKASISTIAALCCEEIDNHPELIAPLTDENAKRYFVEQIILESWLIHKDILDKLTSRALYPPDGVEKGCKLYEAYHEGIIEHKVKDIFICIETDKGNLMASGVGEKFFPSISGAINAIEKANAELCKGAENE